jgi:hypothetical protein
VQPRTRIPTSKAKDRETRLFGSLLMGKKIMSKHFAVPVAQSSPWENECRGLCARLWDVWGGVGTGCWFYTDPMGM